MAIPFYTLVWEFGDFLYSGVPLNSTFKLCSMRKKFVENKFDKNKITKTKKKQIYEQLKQVELLLIQNRVLLHSETKKRNKKTKKRNKKNKKRNNKYTKKNNQSEQEPDLSKEKFTISTVWISIFLKNRTSQPEPKLIKEDKKQLRRLKKELQKIEAQEKQNKEENESQNEQGKQSEQKSDQNKENKQVTDQNLKQRKNLIFSKINLITTDLFNRYTQQNKKKTRSNRTIGLLGFKILQLLKKDQHTRESLTVVTGFSKQRICTVIEIYKILHLIEENAKEVLSFNERQSNILPNMRTYCNDLIAARKIRKKLARKVEKLTTKIISRAQQEKVHGDETIEKTQLVAKHIFSILSHPQMQQSQKKQNFKIKQDAKDIIAKLKRHRSIIEDSKNSDISLLFQSNFEFENDNKQKKNLEKLKQNKNLEKLKQKKKILQVPLKSKGNSKEKTHPPKLNQANKRENYYQVTNHLEVEINSKNCTNSFAQSSIYQNLNQLSFPNCNNIKKVKFSNENTLNTVAIQESATSSNKEMNTNFSNPNKGMIFMDLETQTEMYKEPENDHEEEQEKEEGEECDKEEGEEEDEEEEDEYEEEQGIIELNQKEINMKFNNFNYKYNSDYDYNETNNGEEELFLKEKKQKKDEEQEKEELQEEEEKKQQVKEQQTYGQEKKTKNILYSNSLPSTNNFSAVHYSSEIDSTSLFALSESSNKNWFELPKIVTDEIITDLTFPESEIVQINKKDDALNDQFDTRNSFDCPATGKDRFLF
ncbi:survival of motor neuron-related-splicing factor [Anaeramoeba flamelloides]|uniref:Survival of motor neuron-related-splicing factor n=1 Tax=Anaeramoeba flamelloides TaxID=1746091 RepID=A0AAV8A582_9EUKA|nr:survival of motor neuron-related-splicing factor [Anaeramoeba flamelloides]